MVSRKQQRGFSLIRQTVQLISDSGNIYSLLSHEHFIAGIVDHSVVFGADAASEDGTEFFHGKGMDPIGRCIVRHGFCERVLAASFHSCR